MAYVPKLVLKENVKELEFVKKIVENFNAPVKVIATRMQ